MAKIKKKAPRKKVPDASWNHRILAHEYCYFEKKMEVYFKIHEVHYEKGKPRAYTDSGITIRGKSIEDLRVTIARLPKALTQPILWAGDKWPKEYKPVKRKS